MASETSVLRPKVLDWLKPLHAVPVENGDIVPGIPDVNYADGWIELKHLDAWPQVSDERYIKCDHYTIQQRLWAIERRVRGGQVWFFIQIGKDYLLFEGLFAALNIGLLTKPQMFQAATDSWHNQIGVQGFRECILQRQRNFSSPDDALRKLKQKLHAVITSL